MDIETEKELESMALCQYLFLKIIWFTQIWREDFSYMCLEANGGKIKVIHFNLFTSRLGSHVHIGLYNAHTSFLKGWVPH